MTIGQTSVSIAKLIDHSIRRTGLPVEIQTPEIVETARSNLYLILMNLANVGINLWAQDEKFLALEEGKGIYQLPIGTVDILNSNYRTITSVSGTDTEDATTFVTEFSLATNVVMIYIDSPTTSMTISRSDDGITYTDVITIENVENPEWFSVDNCKATTFVKLTNSTALSITEVRYASGYKDVPLYRLNKDDYLSLPNKHSSGTPLQYWMDRQLSPVIKTWPVCDSNSDGNVIQILRQREISDVGSLSQTLQIPPRWYEAIVWLLAANMAFEVPGVAPERITLCNGKAQSALAEAQMEERDNSPINLMPEIGVYTR